MHKLHQVAERYGQRPSVVMGVDNEWAAYQLDAAAVALATRVYNAQTEKKPVALILRNLNEPVETQLTKAYRPAAGLVTKKMKIPESGVW